MRPSLLVVLCLAIITSLPAYADPAAQAIARHRLQQQQLQDDLALRMQQDIARNQPGLTLRDRQKLDDLALRQRMEQQQLDQQQVVESRQSGRDRTRRDVQQNIFGQERDLQLQRFRAEQQLLMQSSQPAPLQPAPRAGELTLP